MRKRHNMGILDQLPGATEGERRRTSSGGRCCRTGAEHPVVMGDRVFLMTEGGWKSDTAELVCLSATRWKDPVAEAGRPHGCLARAPRSEGKAKRAMEIKRWKTFFHYWNRLLWDNEKSDSPSWRRNPTKRSGRKLPRRGGSSPSTGSTR